jgi:hypothetical protein
MPAKSAYLIRNARGHMRTVQAQSHRGAMKIYLEQYPTTPGETLEVKQRGAGSDDWTAFRVS